MQQVVFRLIQTISSLLYIFRGSTIDLIGFSIDKYISVFGYTFFLLKCVVETCTHENSLRNHMSKWTNARSKANYIAQTVLLNIRTSSYQYMNSHHKHKTVLRLPYLYNGNFRTDKDSIYIEAGLSKRHGCRLNVYLIKYAHYFVVFHFAGII